MTKEREFSYIAENEGRVDLISSRVLSIPRSVFSYPSMSIMVDGKAVRKSERIKEGSKVEIKYTEEVMEGLEKEDIPLSVLYEDDDILVIDKAQGMSVHPGAGNWSGTVANALLGLYGEDFETGDAHSPPRSRRRGRPLLSVEDEGLLLSRTGHCPRRKTQKAPDYPSSAISTILFLHPTHSSSSPLSVSTSE